MNAISYRQLIFIALLLVIPLASFFIVFRPQNQAIARARQEIELKQAMLSKLREATARSSDLERANAEIGESIAAIESRLPSDKEMDLVLRDVAKIAENAGLLMKNFKRSEKPLPAGLAMEQPLTVEIEGDFDGFYRFLLELERLPRITRLPDFQMERMDDVDGALTTRFTLSVYYQGEDPATLSDRPTASAGASK